jgi:O-antigen ligase
MSFSFSQLKFLFFFNILFLLLILFGESYLGLYMMGGLNLLFLFFRKNLDFERDKRFTPIFFLWFLFLFALFLSAFFTHLITFTLNNLISFVFSFTVFCFFAFIRDDFLPKKVIVESFLLQGVILLLISVLFYLVPNWATQLPGVNLVYSTYGHNHLAAFLLLITPISWWWAKDKQKTAWILPIIFTLGLLLSFGRVAIVIGFLQFLFLGWFFLRNGENISQNSFLKKTYFLFLSLFLVLLVTKTFFSVAHVFYPDFTCPVPKFEAQVCKSFNAEFRPAYWEQALLAIKEYPLTGYGPGTFPLVNKKHRQTSWITTNYAHNAFLQIFSESGVVVGGIFVALMVFLLVSSLKVVKKNQSVLDITFLVGLVAMYFNVLLDFDWSFISIFSLTLIFVALIIKKKDVTSELSFYPEFVKIFYSVFSFFIIGLAGIYFLVESLLLTGRINKAFSLFPYFHYHLRVFHESDQLTPENKEKLTQIYRHYSFFYGDYEPLKEIPDPDAKIAYCLADNWLCLRWFNPEENWMTEEVFVELVKKIFESEQKYDEIMETGVKPKMAQMSLGFAEKYFQEGNYYRSGYYFLLAQELDNWILSEKEDSILDKNTLPPEKLNEFMYYFNDIQGEYYGKNWQPYSQAYRVLLNTELEKENSDLYKIQFLAEKILEISPWLGEEMKVEAARLQEIADKEIEMGDIARAEQALSIMKELDKGDYLQVSQLAYFYTMFDLNDQALEEFESCFDSYLEFQGTKHEDCFWDMNALNGGWIDRNKYWEVSNEIRSRIR